MTRPRHAACLLALALLAAGCASPEEDRAQPEVLSLRCEQPMSVLAFLQLAQRTTGKIYTVDARLVEGVEVSWLGDVQVARDEMEEFVGVMLRVHGLQLQPRHAGDVDVLQVVPAEPR